MYSLDKDTVVIMVIGLPTANTDYYYYHHNREAPHSVYRGQIMMQKVVDSNPGSAIRRIETQQ